MGPEKFIRNCKIITTTEGARKIFSSKNVVDSNPDDYFNRAIDLYKKSVSENIKGVNFVFFKSNNKPYVLIIDQEGISYHYDPENNTIIREEKL